MKKINVKDLCYMALYVALAIVLDYAGEFIPFLKMPQGGSINLAVIPVFIASYHLGWKKGAAVGLLWWLVSFLLGMSSWYVSPMQYALDYIVPAAICGFACVFPRMGKISNMYIGIVGANIVRYVCTLLSGVYFWFPDGAVAGSSAAWVYSLGYNLWYNLATMIVAIIIVPLLLNRLTKTSVEFEGIR